MSSIIEALSAIQGQLKAPKDQNAGRYRYRNIEDINQAVKPIAAGFSCAVIYSDRFDYETSMCISTCTLMSSDDQVSAKGFAKVNMQPKGMSVEQACGAASSYARKYAACGLFAIDSSENDPDRTNATIPEPDMREEDYRVDREAIYAKKRLWAAINHWAELQGTDPKEIASSVKQRPDYTETADSLNAIALEFEKACEG